MSNDIVERVRRALESCKGEHLVFEDWAVRHGYDMDEHPLHYLFVDIRTNAARQGWKAALDYVGKVVGTKSVPATKGSRPTGESDPAAKLDWAGAGTNLTSEVRRLVIAARNVAFDTPPSAEALKELDAASEAFAGVVPWDEEPAPRTSAARAATIEEFAKEVEATDWVIPLQGNAKADEAAKSIALMVLRQAANHVRRIDWTGIEGER